MRIYLRALEVNDHILINKWRNNPEIKKNFAANSFFVSSERDKKWVEERILNDRKDLTLVICLKENNKMIGFTSIKDIDHWNKKVEWSGIVIGEEKDRGKGYSVEVQKLVLQYLFYDLGMNRVYAYQLEANQASIAMVKKIGFEIEGVVRESLFKDNKYQNLLLISILKSEFEKMDNDL